MTLLPNLLICDDDFLYQLNLKNLLKGKFLCKSAYKGDEVIPILRNSSFDILLLDVKMQTATEGLYLIPKFLEIDPELAIVMNSSTTDLNTVKQAMKFGAVDYLQKECETEEILHTLCQVIERRSLLRHQAQHNFEIRSVLNQHVLIGESPPLIKLKRTLEKVRTSKVNVIVSGESGTGKELVARQLRRSLPNGLLAPFIPIDSSTIQSATAVSVLFGHDKGAFTGADKTTKGLFEEANGGTIYFDEISNMPLDIQSKLLRVLQEKEVNRLGSTKTIKLDFNVVCASNQNLEQMVHDGRFKEDLFQRLNVIPIHVPPLRDRTEDIPILIEYFLKKEACAHHPLYFSESVMNILRSYRWPGNIRELEHLIYFLITLCEGSQVAPEDLPPRFKNLNSHAPSTSLLFNPVKTPLSFYDKVAEFESKLLTKEYSFHAGSITQLALNLGMDRSHLYAKLKEYKIRPSHLTESP